MSLSLDRLRNFVMECRDGMPATEIRRRVEEMETKEFEVICDGQGF